MPLVDASLMNFFRPGGLNPSIVGALLRQSERPLALHRAGDCDGLQPVRDSTPLAIPPTLHRTASPSATWTRTTPTAAPIYHGFTANLRKRFGSHYEFLASYTWSHAIDDSTDLQSTLTPQDSYFPGLDRSTFAVRPASSLRLQRRLSDWQSRRQRIRQQSLSATGHSLR